MAYTANIKTSWKYRLIAAVEYLINFGSDSNAAGAHDTTAFEKVNATPIVSGTSVSGTALGGDIDFITCEVEARTPGATATTLPTANTGTVYLSQSATSLVGAIPLTPGQFVNLEKGNLSEWFLCVAVATEGVRGNYTV